MSTITQPNYVIDAHADAKLNEISSEFADALLAVAASRTRNRDSHNRPLVDSCDIEEAAHLLCAFIQKAIASGEVGAESEQFLQSLQAVCDAFSDECQQPTPASPGGK